MNEGVARRIIRTLSMVLNRALVVVLCLPLAMGCYALWDSHVVYERANVSQWQPYKPTEPEPLSFWELQRINPEVRAWLSVYGTNIDYPVCQAAQGSEDKYVTTNAKGEYSLSGALFMDTANAADFSDFVTIVYGHHMDRHEMFGDLDLYLDKDFFDANTTGTLMIPGQSIPLSVLSVMVVGDTDATYSGEAMKATIDALNKLEQDYLALFTGVSEFGSQSASFEVSFLVSLPLMALTAPVRVIRLA